MELRAYLRILFEKWWIVLTVFLITFISTYVFTINQPLIYETETTFVTRPRASANITTDDDAAKLVDTLSRRIESQPQRH